jgi:hypothetical protein
MRGGQFFLGGVAFAWKRLQGTNPISDIAMTATLRPSETKDYPFLP